MPCPRFACALSTSPRGTSAFHEAVDGLEQGLDGRVPSLVAAFATHHHGDALEDLGPRIARATGTSVVIGCTAESVIGDGREVERRPGIALWAADLPETEVRYFECTASMAPTGEPAFSRLPPVGSVEDSSILLTADPFSFPVDSFLAAVEERYPRVPAVGGMASGAEGPGQSLFFTADGVREQGAVGVVLEGGVEFRTIVSQGCRPVGKPWVITACERNRITQLGGRPALEVLMETWNSLPRGEQALLEHRPFLGLAIDPTQTVFRRGDFLVRAIMGLYQRERAIAVADFVRRGQTVQLLVRDPESAGEDLRWLASEKALDLDREDPSCAGALVFSCNGRGRRMFETPDHDTSCLREGLAAEIPMAGFFAAGEIGPVGGRNFLHGFTASVALLGPRPA